MELRIMDTEQSNVVLFSMGICSAYIACRLQDECQHPICLFSDTKREDEDTYRFGREVAERWGLNVVEASRGGDLWDSFRRDHMIPARQISMCSLMFKILPSRAWLNEHFELVGRKARVAYGYDMDESKRASRTMENWDFKNVEVWFPMFDWGVTKAQAFGYFAQHGIQPPRMYKHFQHANCLPCKNFRINDWVALQYHYPHVFADAAVLEVTMGLKWMQEPDMPRLVDLPVLNDAPSRKGRRKLIGDEPAFSFDMGCDRCAVD
jgi:3'-phosphoadenosine 5'-phosphosulfate sulfotransferase (PAPS reductase)/FAD synthetase